ncbi:hypothetical protein ACS125_18660 [Acinetobacter sp. PFS20]|uniref:hypothetical protein n=1 Tax=Acinetobacter sp. PFS20 TaxID=3458434 RepID=UPI003FD01A3F
MKAPTQTTHIETDGTFWSNWQGNWFFWRNNFGWCPYVGSVNKAFLNNKREIGVNA